MAVLATQVILGIRLLAPLELLMVAEAEVARLLLFFIAMHAVERLLLGAKVVLGVGRPRLGLMVVGTTLAMAIPVVPVVLGARVIQAIPATQERLRQH